MVGLDCEYYSEDCTEFSDQKLALLQIASEKKAWIVDCIDLIHEEGFKKFFQELMGDEKILKIGHSFMGDIKVFKHTFKTSVNKIQNLIDIKDQNQNQSLATIVERELKKNMCKYEQRSNWSKRPLRKTQLHYAIVDAAVLLKVYQSQSEGKELKNFDHIQIGHMKNQEQKNKV